MRLPTTKLLSTLTCNATNLKNRAKKCDIQRRFGTGKYPLNHNLVHIYGCRSNQKRIQRITIDSTAKLHYIGVCLGIC